MAKSPWATDWQRVRESQNRRTKHSCPPRLGASSIARRANVGINMLQCKGMKELESTIEEYEAAKKAVQWAREQVMAGRFPEPTLPVPP